MEFADLDKPGRELGSTHGGFVAADPFPNRADAHVI